MSAAASDEVNWGARTSWNRAAPQFDRVFMREVWPRRVVGEDVDHEDDAQVSMTYHPTSEEWSPLRSAWQRVRSHPHVLEAVADERYGVTLRYAAIDWYPERSPSAVDIASWLVQIADGYRRIVKDVAADELWLFSEPLVFFDLGGAARLAFRWPGLSAKRALDERDLVSIVGRSILKAYPSAALGSILATCTHVEPKLRYRTLAALQKTCRKTVRMDEPIRAEDRLIAWELVEAGMGFIAVHRIKTALDRFHRALEYDDYRDIARWGRDFAQASVYRLPLTGHVDHEMPSTGAGDVDAGGQIAEARRAIASRDAAYARTLMQELLRRDPDNVEAVRVIVSAYLELGNNADALAYTDTLVARAPGDGTYHYLRGKVLFRLSRLPEARDAFERALVLNPLLSEALHLRREVDRAIGTARKTVGSQHAPVIDIPESLEPLREVLARGRSREIVEALSRVEHDDNADAQLLLARFLTLEGEAGRASAIYQRFVDAPAPYRQRALVGRAGLLLEAGAHESALALFDIVCAEATSDLDASEGRAQALDRLGRIGEAAAEWRRFVGLANARADLRVRAAQQWLDAHAL